MRPEIAPGSNNYRYLRVVAGTQLHFWQAANVGNQQLLRNIVLPKKKLWHGKSGMPRRSEKIHVLADTKHRPSPNAFKKIDTKFLNGKIGETRAHRKQSS